MVNYYVQPCDNPAEWIEQYNSQPSRAFWEITTGEAISNGSLREWVSTTNSSYLPKLILASNIPVLIPPDGNGVYQYLLEFYFKYKVRGYHSMNYAGSDTYFPAIFVETDTNRCIGGIGIACASPTSYPDQAFVIPLYANTGDPQGGLRWNAGYFTGITIATDVWHKFTVLISPQIMKIYYDDNLILEDTTARPNLAPSKICVQSSIRSVGTEDILVDEITLRSVLTRTLTISPTTHGSLSIAPGTYSYADGATVTINAIPDSGYRLAGWQYNGSVSTTNPLVLTMTKDFTVQAVFELDITPPTPPVANFSVQTQDLAAYFDGSSSYATTPSASITGYAWDFGDGGTGSGVNPAHGYAVAGTYTVSLTVTDSNGLTDTMTASVTVTAPATPPVANFSISTTNLTVSLNGSSSYATTSGAVLTGYGWSFGDGATGSGQTTTHVYATAGTYQVTLTVTDSNGLTGSVVKSVTVTSDGGNTNPVADYITTPTGLLSVSFNGSGSYPTTSGATIVSYAWNFGDGQSGTGATVTHVYATSGTYQVTLTVTDSNGLTGFMGQSISVGTPEEAGFPWWLLGVIAGVGVVGGVAAMGGKKGKKGRKGTKQKSRRSRRR